VDGKEKEGKEGKARTRGAFRQIKIYDYTPGSGKQESCRHKETARCSVFFLHPMTFDCYLLRATKGQGRYSTGLANVKLNIRCSILLPKSRLNVKNKYLTRAWRTCFEAACIMTLQGHRWLLILAPIETAYMGLPIGPQ